MKAYLIVLLLVFLARGFMKIVLSTGMFKTEENIKDLSSTLTLILFFTILGVVADALIIVSLIAAFASQF